MTRDEFRTSRRQSPEARMVHSPAVALALESTARTHHIAPRTVAGYSPKRCRSRHAVHTTVGRILSDLRRFHIFARLVDEFEAADLDQVRCNRSDTTGA